MTYQTQRILIWGKTYPELSWHHEETVCTGGCLPDGRPIRVYPVPLRYLPKHQQYKLYDWIEVPAALSTKDARPESHKVRAPGLRVVGHATTSRGWLERRKVILADRSWQYGCLDDLKDEQRRSKRSLGLVRVHDVIQVKLEKRPDDERARHEEKLAELRARPDLFGHETKGLEFYPYKVRLRWRCESDRCPASGHSAAVMDWGLGELGRRDGPQKALQKMRDLSDLRRYDLRLFMGNMKARQHVFGIVALWYPLRRDIERYGEQGELFTRGG